MFYSGEFHPFRLPVPGLWLDVFQKIKAMGFSGVSFYTDWGLLEGKQGQVITDGVFGLDELFRAAKEAGIYLLARPGPYVNAELAAGGLPGWVLRLKAVVRSTDPEYLNATQNYVSTIGKIIADAQITNDGPVVLVQPENEYSTYPGVTNFPNQMNKEYMAFVEQQLRDTGIVVPLVDNDNRVLGSFAPGTGLGAVDLYGIDAYPLRYDCKRINCDTKFYLQRHRWTSLYMANRSIPSRLEHNSSATEPFNTLFHSGVSRWSGRRMVCLPFL